MASASPVLVARCRDLARMQLPACVAGAIDALSQDAAGREIDDAEERALLDRATTEAGKARREVVAAFERHLLELFDEKAGRAAPAKAADAPLKFESFSLVDDTAIDEQIALDRLKRKARDEINADTLAGIEIRVGEILGRGRLEGEANPVGPEVALTALKRACDVVPADAEVRTLLVSALQPRLAAGLRTLYEEMNELLRSEGVSPTLRFQIQRSTTTTPSKPAAGTAAPGQGGASVPAKAGGEGRGGDVSVSQMMSLRELMPLMSGVGDLGAVLTALAEGLPAARHFGARMLAEAGGELYTQAMQVPVSPELIAALTAAQTQVPVATGGVMVPGAALAPVRNLAAAQEHPLDQLTGELVAVIFDFILNERDVPQTVKNEIARLQVVAFKAALLDRSFFARREHPLRILLAGITDLGADPDVDTAPESAFVTRLHEVVDDLIARFEHDLSIFEPALERVREAAAEVVKPVEKETEVIARALEQRERGVQADAIAEAEMKPRAAGTPVEFVRSFLTDVWQKVVAKAELEGGEAARALFVALADDLVWSVGPKSRTEIPRLAGMLPKLVPGLQKGMAGANVPAPQAQAFLEELMKTHTALLQAARAVKVGNVPPPPEPEKPPPPPVKAEDIRPEQLAVPPGLGQLERGTVVEFTDREPPQRAKLGWVSPKRTMYAFRSITGGPRSFSAAELADALRVGAVRVLDLAETTVDRAVKAVTTEQPGETAAR